MQAQMRIGALALVHRILHEIEIQATVDLKRVLHDLAHQSSEGMQSNDGHIRLEEDTISRGVSGDLAVPIALFVAEVLTNTFKHAFPPGQKGLISISLTPYGRDSLRLAISDNGIGFDGSIDAGGLGSRLIDSLAQQLCGTATTCSVPGKGTRVELIFKDPDSVAAVAN